MNAKKEESPFVLGSGAAALVLAVVIFALTFNINSYKPPHRGHRLRGDRTGCPDQWEDEASFFPFGVSAKDIHVANKGGEILSLENLKVGGGVDASAEEATQSHQLQTCQTGCHHREGCRREI